jgi:hypothetical protein
MANLSLHVGSKSATREQVNAVATPLATPTWVPVPHHQILDSVQTQLATAGLRVVSEAHGLSSDGNRYFGLLHVANGVAESDFGLVVGIRNSHDKSFPAGLVLGASVFVCDNLSFSGEVRLNRKHTVHIQRDFPQVIARAVGRLGELRCEQEKRFLTYRQTELSTAQGHDLIIQALDNRVVPVTKVPAVLKEWREPRHPEFKANGFTAWRLQNAFTEILKENLDELPRRTQALHGILDGACGLVLAV